MGPEVGHKLNIEQEAEKFLKETYRVWDYEVKSILKIISSDPDRNKFSDRLVVASWAMKATELARSYGGGLDPHEATIRRTPALLAAICQFENNNLSEEDRDFGLSGTVRVLATAELTRARDASITVNIQRADKHIENAKTLLDFYKKLTKK